MTGITYFVALPLDVADGSVVVGEPINIKRILLTQMTSLKTQLRSNARMMK
jgi:hypothetical protein